MNIKWGLFCFFLISGLLLTNFTSGQKKHTGLKAYLIVHNQSTVIKNDSLFEKELRTQLRSVLKKKNIILIPNEETETFEQPHFYIKVDISDSLRISDWKSIASQGLGVVNVLPKKKYSLSI